MVRAVAPEDEIPWLQIVKGDRRCFRLLRIRRAGDRNAVFRVNILHKPTAVKAIWRRAAPDIWHAQIFHRRRHDLVADRFRHIGVVHAVGFQALPECALVCLDQHQDAALHRNHAVGQLLDKRHWRIGDVAFHLEGIVGAVRRSGDRRLVVVVIELHIAAGDGKLDLARLFVRIRRHSSAHLIQRRAQRQIKGAFLVDDRSSELVAVNMIIARRALYSGSHLRRIGHRRSIVSKRRRCAETAHAKSEQKQSCDGFLVHDRDHVLFVVFHRQALC